jgi:hypothetical protein
MTDDARLADRNWSLEIDANGVALYAHESFVGVWDWRGDVFVWTPAAYLLPEREFRSVTEAVAYSAVLMERLTARCSQHG